MSKSETVKRPGWSIIEKYMPHDRPEEQEEAYENLRGLVKVLMEMDDRLSREEADRQRELQPSLF